MGYVLIEYMAGALPVLVGTIVHTFALDNVPERWLTQHRRFTIALYSLLLPGTVLFVGWVLGGNTDLSADWFPAFLVGSIIYGFVATCPEGR